MEGTSKFRLTTHSKVIHRTRIYYCVYVHRPLRTHPDTFRYRNGRCVFLGSTATNLLHPRPRFMLTCGNLGGLSYAAATLGVCVANPHEGAFDDPDHFIMQFITGENAPVTLLGGGLGLVGICVLAYYLIKYLDENNAEDDIGEPALAELRAKNCCTKCCTRNGRACQGILAVFMLAGGAALFLGLFVLDSMTAVLVGFVVLIVVVVFQVVWNICKDHRKYKKEVDKYGDKIEALDNKDDGDLHDDSGAETSTRYMDFEQ